MARTFRASSGNTARTFTREIPCPKCGKHGGCAMFEDGGILCYHVPGDRVTSGGNLHFAGRDWRDEYDRLPARPPDPVVDLDLDLLDRAYSALLAACPLSQAHLDWLAGKGVSREQAERWRYGTLPADPAARRRAERAVIDAVGPVTGIVPGFGRHGIVAYPGEELLFPFIDETGRVAGVQRRMAEDDPKGRYRWLSKGGASIPGCTVHHARPVAGNRVKAVWITEGPRKADVAADALGYVVLAVAGIPNTAGIPTALAAYPDIDTVIVAYDEECHPDPEESMRKRENVAQAEQALVTRIMEARPELRIMQAVWPAEVGKGIDDCLQNRLVPLMLPHPVATAAAAPVTDIGEVRQLREEARLISRIVAKNDLGGDVGGAAAIRLVNWAAAQATEHNIQPGDVIPLVAKKIASEYWDADRGEYVEAVSRTTLTKRIDDFKDKGIIPTAPARHTYRYQGEQRSVEVPGLVWPDGGRIELLRMFASGSVLEPGEPRQRGGKREPRRPLVCAVCAGANEPTANEARFTCTCCGTIYRSGEVHRDHITMSESLPDHRALVENDGDATANEAIVWPDDDQSDGEVEHRDLVENDGADIVSSTDESLSGEPSFSVQVREPWRMAEAIRLYSMLVGKNASPEVRGGRLVFDESRLNERALRRVFDHRPELVAYIEGMAANTSVGSVEHRDLLENDGPSAASLFGDDEAGEAGADRWTA